MRRATSWYVHVCDDMNIRNMNWEIAILLSASYTRRPEIASKTARSLLQSELTNKIVRTFAERSQKLLWWTVETRYFRPVVRRCSSTCDSSWTCKLFESDLPWRVVEWRRNLVPEPRRNRAERIPSCFQSASLGGSFLHPAVNHHVTSSCDTVDKHKSTVCINILSCYTADAMLRFISSLHADSTKHRCSLRTLANTDRFSKANFHLANIIKDIDEISFAYEWCHPSTFCQITLALVTAYGTFPCNCSIIKPHETTPSASRDASLVSGYAQCHIKYSNTRYFTIPTASTHDDTRRVAAIDRDGIDEQLTN